MATRKTKPSAPTAADVPVTRAMLGGLRSEVLERIDQAREESKADAQRLESKLASVESSLRAEIREIDAGLHEVKAEIHEVKASVARIEVLVEEQNARNRIVLDGITTLLGRQDQVERRVTEVEDTVRRLASAPRG